MAEKGIDYSTDLARALGLEATNVRDWRSGRHRPNAAACRKLAEFFGRPEAEVLALAGHGALGG